jgi:pimeloyl-ACP methyl ester carboxylesterase
MGDVMRRFVVLTVATLVGVLAWARYKGRWAALAESATGVFPNGMAYARWGSGPRTLLFIPGGPGNNAPGGWFMGMMLGTLRGRLGEHGYSVWAVARKRDMPKGHTIADMADDYAELIRDEFGGRVDVVLGVSFGGHVGLSLAARHPDRFGHIVIAASAYRGSERGLAFDLEAAQLQSEGRDRELGALMFRMLVPRNRVPGLDRVAGVVMGRLWATGRHPWFRSDVLVEAEASRAFDARDILPTIDVPVLLIAGDQDIFFPADIIEETARLIPDCTLRLYAGKGHDVFTDRRMPEDMLDFIASHPR